MTTPRAYRVLNRRRVLIEASVTPKIRAELYRMSEQAGRDYSAGGLERAVAGLDSHFDAIRKLLERTYQLSVSSMASYMEDTMGKSYRPMIEKKGIIGSAWAKLKDVFMGHALTQSTSIVETSREDVRSTIIRLAEEGTPEIEMANAIVDKLKVGGRPRAQTIARTETGYGLNRSQAELIDELDLPPMLKVWMSSPGGRTRKAHKRADNQKREQNEPFIVDGEKLMYPMDSAGSAKNVINCRCMMNQVMKPDAS